MASRADPRRGVMSVRRLSRNGDTKRQSLFFLADVESSPLNLNLHIISVYDLVTAASQVLSLTPHQSSWMAMATKEKHGSEIVESVLADLFSQTCFRTALHGRIRRGSW